MEHKQLVSKRQGNEAMTLGIGAGLAVATLLCPSLGGKMSTTCAVAGAMARLVGHLTEDEDWETAGKAISDGAAIGGLAGALGTALRSDHSCSLCKSSKRKM